MTVCRLRDRLGASRKKPLKSKRRSAVHDTTNTAARFGGRAGTSQAPWSARPAAAYFVLKICGNGTIESTGTMLIPSSPPPTPQPLVNGRARGDGKEILNVSCLLSAKKATPQMAAYAQAFLEKSNRS